MDNSGYIGLSRQIGLQRELTAVANNLANMNTNGFRREGSIFAEHIEALQSENTSISMSTLSRRYVDLSAGELSITDQPLDVAIDGDGFFLVETPAGDRLTRDGAFSLNADRELVNSQQLRILDESGGAIAIPQGQNDIIVAEDGSIFAGGQPVGRLGVVVADPTGLVREGGNLFEAQNGFTTAENPRVQQGVVEGSNVNAIEEMARLIEVQRTYEASKRFTEDENERITRTVRTIGQTQ